MLIPRPRLSTPGVGSFEITPSTRIVADAPSETVRLYLQQTLRGSTGLPVRDADRRRMRGISLRVDGSDDTLLTGPGGDRSESFRLVVDSDHVEVVGGGPAGVFYGVQALLQLLPADVYRQGARRHRARGPSPRRRSRTRPPSPGAA